MTKRRWKVLLAGSPGSGKSTLCGTLLRLGRDVRKTQSPEFHGDMVVDLPGEYVTISRFRMAFLATAQDAEIILYLQAANEEQALIPPGLLQTPPGITLAGVITKVDAPGADVDRARNYLKQISIPEPYFPVCALREDSLAELKEWLDSRLSGGFPANEGGVL